MTHMHIDFEILELHSRHAFHIARAASPAVRRTVWLRLRDDDGIEGWGEAAANAYYGETADTVVALLPIFERVLNDMGDDVFAIERAESALESAIHHNPAARAALSAALHDRAAKKLGVPVWRMWGLDPAAAPPSSFTLGIDDLDTMRRKLEEASDYPILKIKVGTPHDRDVLELIRTTAPDKTLRVDANTAWSAKQAIAMLPLLEDAGVELIEQPLKPDDYDGMRMLRDRSPIPIVADESCRVAADVPRLAGCVDGVNIKLEKCASLREGLRIVHVARAHHMKVMVGCMLSSTLAMAAAMQLAPLADWIARALAGPGPGLEELLRARAAGADDDATLGRIVGAAAEAGRFDLAQEALETLLARRPADPELWNMRARIAAARGDRAGAAAHLEHSLELRPEQPLVWNAVGELHASAGRTDAAREAFERALALDPSLEVARRNRTRLGAPGGG
jgi:L-alanine-DL-glutamate epimerase-like enolase superfamily enzyme